MNAADDVPRLAIIGAGSRGLDYAESAVALGAKIAAVAEPDEHRRKRLVDRFGSSSTAQSASWDDLELEPGHIDGVIIATMDDMHVEPTLRFARLAVPVMLEKPIGRTWNDCRRLRDGLPPGAHILVAHVLRYAPYTKLIRSMIDDGALGDVVNIHHFEPVGFWHFAHSFVRGNWRSSATAAPFLVTKACHDVDWIMHLIDAECVAVSSFSSLSHFRSEHRPEGAAERCVDCAVECVYDARTLYHEPARMGDFAWPVDSVCTDLTFEEVSDAVNHGRFGRCVYLGRNDMPDAQVGTLLFSGGQLATLTVSAFTELRSRHSIVSGTKGEATVTWAGVELYSFADRRRSFWSAAAAGSGAQGSEDRHGGGDNALMQTFLAEVASPSAWGRAAFAEALRSHQVAFALEEASRIRQVVDPRSLNAGDEPSGPVRPSVHHRPRSCP